MHRLDCASCAIYHRELANECRGLPSRGIQAINPRPDDAKSLPELARTSIK